MKNRKEYVIIFLIAESIREDTCLRRFQIFFITFKTPNYPAWYRVDKSCKVQPYFNCWRVGWSRAALKLLF